MTKQVVASCHKLLQAITCEAHLGHLKQVGNECGRANKDGYISLKMTDPLQREVLQSVECFKESLQNEPQKVNIILFIDLICYLQS